MSDISDLLEKNNLTHFKYYEDQSRIIYTFESGTSLHIEDFHRLIVILKQNNIKHEDIGIDVILIN